MIQREDIWPIDPGRQFDLRTLVDLPANALRVGADGDATLVFRGESAAWHDSLFAYRVDGAGRFVDVRPVWPDASDARFDPARARDLDGRGPLHEGDSVHLRDIYGDSLAPGEHFGLLLVADGARRIPAARFAEGRWTLIDTSTGEAPGPGSRAADIRLVHESPDGVRSWSRGLWFATDPTPDEGPGHSLNADGVEHVIWAEDGGSLWLGFEDLDTREYDRPARNYIDLILEVRTDPLAPRTCPLPLDADHLAGGVGSLAQGSEPGARFGYALARGDFDGDGAIDLAIGSPRADDGRGAVTLLFGLEDRPLTLDPARTVTLLGEAADDRLGTSLAAGDVDGDGRDELLIGAIGVDGGGPDSGALYVVDGSAAVDGPVAAAAEVRIDGLVAGDELGRSVDAGVDIDGDGFEDVVVGARLAEADYARYSGGLSWLLFGGDDGLADDLGALDGTRGLRIEGGGRFDQSGRSVALLGDIDGDGFADLAVGAPDADPFGRENAGEVLVVFGGADGWPASLAPADLDGVRGFRIAGPNAGAFAGFDVAPAGDVDGDGFDDLIVGTYGPLAEPAGQGGAFVLYGRESWSAWVDLADLAPGEGTLLHGPGSGEEGGLARAVASAGDVDGDGFDDLLVGGRYTDLEAGGEGVAYLVWGREDRPAAIDLARLDATHEGCRLLGTGADVYAGYSFTGPADIDGDGFDDVVLGAPGEAGSDEPGTVFVVYGGPEEPAGTPAPMPLLASPGSGDGPTSGRSTLTTEPTDEDALLGDPVPLFAQALASGAPPTAEAPLGSVEMPARTAAAPDLPPTPHDVDGAGGDRAGPAAPPEPALPSAAESDVLAAAAGIGAVGLASLLFGDITPHAGFAARFGLEPPPGFEG